jgi:hypothetical protein
MDKVKKPSNFSVSAMLPRLQEDERMICFQDRGKRQLRKDGYNMKQE